MFKNTVKEQLKVPAHFDYLGELRDFVTRIGRKHGLSDKVINAFKLSIDEAGSNVIRHAYREFDEPGFILLRVIVRKASITVSLIDQGKYFDPRFVKNPDLKRYVDIGKKGGLGIFIIRKLMDEIDYRKTEEGNELRLTKYLDPDRRIKRLPSKVANIPLTLKAKYFIWTAAIITSAICAGYFYFYLRAGTTIRQVVYDDLYSFGEHIDSLVVNEPTIPYDLRDTQGLVTKIKQEYGNRIYEIIILDNDGIVQGNLRGNDDDSKWLNKFVPPEKSEKIQEKIYKARISDRSGQETDVFEYISTLMDRDKGAKKGELHIRRLKSHVDDAVSEKRWEEARLALFILLSSYLGTIVLIYVLLNPFKKLGDWIRALDHGDEVEDEMDIDSSTEIGEIAKAFSEITTKFRQSQKNLVEQEQLQKEMQVAQEIQQTLLPTDFPELEGYEISSLYQAAKEVGGDYYDFVEVDKDTLGIVVADVSGKGVPGSLVMTMIRTALRTEARGMRDAAEVLARVNDFVVNDMKKGMFVTIFYVIIDSKRRRLNYASAGHNPMILYRPSVQKTYYLNPKGFPIGIQLAETDLFRSSIESDTIQLAEDDILILYTDGITEAMNGSRDLFGEERFLKSIREHGLLRVKPFVEKLQLEIESFTEGAVQYDDITLVSIKERTTQEKEELRRAKLAHKAILEGKNIRDACEESGITTYAYYNKYKKQFEEHGIENFEVDEDVSVEAKHISIEDKTKIFDIIRNHPEFGAKRISEELNTEKYGMTQIGENKIYDELVRSRLNTRQLREAFVTRGDRSKRRMKQPGTPMLTLDGRVIIDRNEPEKSHRTAPRPVEPASRKSQEAKPDATRPPIEIKKRFRGLEDTSVDLEVVNTSAGQTASKKPDPEDDIMREFLEKHANKPPKATSTEPEKSESPALDSGDIQHILAGKDATHEFDFEGMTRKQVEETLHGSSSTEVGKKRDEASSDADENDNLVSSASPVQHGQVEDDFAFTAFEDLLKMEITNSFEDESSNVVVEEAETQEPADEVVAEPASEKESEENEPEPEELPVETTQESEAETEKSTAEQSLNEETESEEPEPKDAEVIAEMPEDEHAFEEVQIEATEADAVQKDEIKESEVEYIASDEDESEDEQAYPVLDAEDFEREEEDDDYNVFIEVSATTDREEEVEEDAADEQDEIEEDEDEDEEQLAQVLREAAEFNSTDLPVLGDDTIEILTTNLMRAKSAQSSSPIRVEKVSKPLPGFDFQALKPRKLHSTRAGRSAGVEVEMQHYRSTEPPVQLEKHEQDESDTNRLEAPDEQTYERAEISDIQEKPEKRNSMSDDEQEELLIAGLRYYKNHEYDRAISQFEKAISQYPDFKEAHSVLGNAYFRKDLYEKATAAYHRVLELDPKDATAHENMGVIYANQGRLDKAIEEWENVIRLDPARSDIKRKIQKAFELLDEGQVISK